MDWCWLLLAGVLFVFGTAEVSASGGRALTSDDVVLAIGDSLTAGYGVRPHQSYPAVLGSLVPAKIVASARAGEKSDAMLARLDRELVRRQYSWVIITTGGADMLKRGSMTALEQNLEKAVDMVRAAGARPVIVAVSIPKSNRDNPVYRRVAIRKNADVIEGLGSMLRPEHFLRDGVHPNASGYRVVVSGMMSFFRD